MTEITIKLSTDLAQKVEQLADLYKKDKNTLFKQMLEHFFENYKNEVREGIQEMNKSLKRYEEKYGKSSKLFYDEFKKGEGEENDSTDFMIWAGVYEMKLKSEDKLKKIL